MGHVDVDRGWQFVSIGPEGQPADVPGVNAWEVEWTPTGSRIMVTHPQYPSQRHTMFIYKVTGPTPTPPIRFAAGEFSNGVWGFFVPAQDEQDPQPAVPRKRQASPEHDPSTIS
jgi:hypothetical protein